MPHVSGGGSHSGGSHHSSSSGGSHSSGSHSSSRSSSYGGSHSSFGSSSHGSSYSSRSSFSSGRSHHRERPRVSREYYAGSQRYVSYQDHSPQYYYVNPGRPSGERKLWRWIFYGPLLLLFITTFFDLLVPSPYVKAPKGAAVVIEDNAGVLGNTAQLESVMQSIMDRTGVTPAVITVGNDAWRSWYKNFDAYALQLYVNHFDDERHWVIAYSQPAGASDGFVDWYWSSVQGDETDKVITKEAAGVFEDRIQKGLLKSGNTVTDALIQAFTETDPYLKVYDGLDFSAAVIDLLFVAGLVWLALRRTGMLRKKDSRPKGLPKDAVPCSASVPEIACEYCGGVYLSDSQKCPYCGAPRTVISKGV